MSFKRLLFIFLSSFLLFISCSGNPIQSNSFAQITADNENFHYIGRIERKNPQEAIFSYPGTACKFKFSGTSLKVKLADDNWGKENYVSVYIDDNPNPIVIQLKNEQQPNIYEITKGLEDKVHTALLVKRNDYIMGEFKFLGILLDANQNLLPLDSQTTRKIEIYGDSISAGSTVEYEHTGTQDPPGNNNHLDNAYLSYGAILAKDYNAELSLIAQSGIALVDGYSYWNNGIGMEAVYDKFKPLKDGLPWNFSDYQPDLIIIALGQNDSSTIDIGKDLSSKEWKNHYQQFIANLRSKYPNSYLICMFPNMYHNPEWDIYLTEAVAEYQNEYQDKKIYFLINQQVTPGHPRTSEQKLMADALENLINNNLVKDGFSW